jgi:hypothetical protein
LQEAQQLVLQAVQSAAPERKFEGNNYFAMVQVGLTGLQGVLQPRHMPLQQGLRSAGIAMALLIEVETGRFQALHACPIKRSTSALHSAEDHCMKHYCCGVL